MGYINNKPHVNFEINKEMDYWTVKEFLTFDPKDTFSETILALHPKLEEANELNDDAKIDFFNKYVDQVYEEKSQELQETQEEIQSKWDNIEEDFLSKTKKLFEGHKWPEGAYVGFLSIFNCNPRFLNQKTFQVYYKHPERPVYVGAHEMLHFMFYDYVENTQTLLRIQMSLCFGTYQKYLTLLSLKPPNLQRSQITQILNLIKSMKRFCLNFATSGKNQKM